MFQKLHCALCGVTYKLKGKSRFGPDHAKSWISSSNVLTFLQAKGHKLEAYGGILVGSHSIFVYTRDFFLFYCVFFII